jgi:hypothetical protein
VFVRSSPLTLSFSIGTRADTAGANPMPRERLVTREEPRVADRQAAPWRRGRVRRRISRERVGGLRASACAFGLI